ADDGMKVASALRLGKDLPDRPEDEEPPEAEAEGEGEGEEAEEKPKSEHDEFFSGGEGATSMLDLSKLGEEDELKELLDEESEKRARKLADEEGVLRDRATEFSDIQLHGDDWAAQYIRKRPAAKKKKKREESEHPEMPYP